MTCGRVLRFTRHYKALTQESTVYTSHDDDDDDARKLKRELTANDFL